jgi:TorA maturation chaperone TorD
MASTPAEKTHDTILLRQKTALGDYFGLLAVLLEYKLLREACVALSKGNLQADIIAITEELDLRDARLTAALEQLNSMKDEAASTEAAYLALRREYTRLFNHPEHPAIAFYEGAFVNRRYKAAGREAPDHEVLFINQAACDADRQYKRARVRRSPEENIPGDCMATEMDFMRHLLQLETEATLKDDAVRLEQLRSWQEEFTQLHLRVWMKDFFVQLESASVLPYFRATGLLGQVLADRCIGNSD